MVINEEIVHRSELTLPEFLVLLLRFYTRDKFLDIAKSLWEKGLLTADVEDYRFNIKGLKLLKNIIAKSRHNLKSRNHTISGLKPFAKELMQLVPNIRMERTCYWYKCNTTEISESLINFYDVYGEYSDDLIKQAIQDYVKEFEGDYTYMKLLRNFIFQVDNNGDCHSELASYIENIQDNEKEIHQRISHRELFFC